LNFGRSIAVGTGWGFTKLFTQILNIFLNFGP